MPRDDVRTIVAHKGGSTIETTRELTNEKQAAVDRAAIQEAFLEIATPTLRQTSEALKPLIEREPNGS